MIKKMKKIDDFVQQRKLEELRRIVGTLNGPDYQKWQQIEHIFEMMTGQSARKRSFFDGIAVPDLAVNVFNDLARNNPVILEIYGEGPKSTFKVTQSYKAFTDMSAMLLTVWKYYFGDFGWKLIKRCPLCKKWFVDESKNNNKLRCSEDCTWKWWNRSRRKEAGHGKRRPHRK